MKTISFLSKAIEGYVKYRKASGRYSYSYIKNIIQFDHFCVREYPEQTELTQEIVDRWCRQRPTECTNSCVSRVYPVLDSCDFPSYLSFPHGLLEMKRGYSSCPVIFYIQKVNAQS